MQLHEGDRVWEGSMERTREPMDKNRIRGDADQGDRQLNDDQAAEEEALEAERGAGLI